MKMPFIRLTFSLKGYEIMRDAAIIMNKQKESMTLPELMERHQISATYIAQRIGMKKGTFNNKLKGNLKQTFSGPEMVQILEVLAEISKDIRNFTTTP